MTSLIKTIKIAQIIVSNIMYPEIKKVESLKETERNNKGIGEMDKIVSIEDLVMIFLNIRNIYNYKINVP